MEIRGMKGIDLQATLATGSATSELMRPHHPILCRSTLSLADDGALSCGHATAGPGDRRTQACIDHSVALLIIELAMDL
jgi:hypothetical protein